MPTSAIIYEETDSYIIYESVCPYDSTIKARIKKEKTNAKPETNDNSVDHKTINSDSDSVAEDEG